jgi:hypothetical protein
LPHHILNFSAESWRGMATQRQGIVNRDEGLERPGGRCGLIAVPAGPPPVRSPTGTGLSSKSGI